MTVLEKPAFDSFATCGTEGMLLPEDRHGQVDLRGRTDTCIWISDLGPGADTQSQYGERLMESLSMLGEASLVGGCFSSIRGLPSKIRVVPVEDTPS